MSTERPLPAPPAPVSPGFNYSPSMKHDPNLKPNPHPYAVKTTTTALLTRSNSTGYNVNAAHHFYVPLSPKANDSPEGRKGHRVSKSVNVVTESPSRSLRPLPIPPSLTNHDTPTTEEHGSASPPEHRKKRAETLPTYPVDEEQQSSVPMEDFPSNPKLWTPSQLSTYLVMALRVTSRGKPGESEPVILPLRVAKDIAAFAKAKMISGRTFLRLTEAELEEMGMNKKWREAILSASHDLRQNVLKGRIWGPEASPSTSPDTTLFSRPSYNSSASSLELSADEGENGDGASRLRRSRSGRVIRMVASFERTGSFSSDDGFDDSPDKENGSIRGEEPAGEPLLQIQSPVEQPSVPGDLPEKLAEDGEPSIEALLMASGSQGLVDGPWGARAWEELDLEPGVTVKRISGLGPSEQADGMQRTVLGINRSGSRRDKGERRVVTTVFTPAGSHNALEICDGAGTLTGAEDCTEDPLMGPHTESQAFYDQEERIENELAVTRTLLETFRSRLEIVEQKVTDLERLEEEHERSRAMEPLPNGCAVTSTSGLQQERDQALLVTAPEYDSAPTQRLLPANIRSLDLIRSAISGPSDATHNDDDDEDGADPSSLVALSSYVLLVGFGVCAVVLRVVFRRIAGRNSLSGWKK